MPVVRNVASVVLLIAAPALLSVSPGAEPQLEVLLSSGRLLHGVMDVDSTSEHLVLRSDQGGITLRRPIEWPRIEEVKSDGVAVEVAMLREKTIAQVGTAQSDPKLRTKKLELRGDAFQDETAAHVPLELPPARVAMVTFDARLANWDADLETDGLVIDVAPLDIDGQIVPVSGTLEVSLYARERRILDQAPNSGGDTTELVERWSQPIAASQRFTAYGTRLRLPFGAAHPELDSKWRVSPYGLVHVRFVVPGHGVFEDSRDGLRLRPFAPNRDRLEQSTGYRFLPVENLGQRN
jgi:hypothetical protein